jgi:FMN phosphatase YigB (HAD superfamily)
MDTLAFRGPRGPAEEITAKVLGVHPDDLLSALQMHEVDAQATMWLGHTAWMQYVLLDVGIAAEPRRAQKALAILATHTARQMQPYENIFDLLWWVKNHVERTCLYSTASPQGTKATKLLGFDQPLIDVPLFSSETGHTKEEDAAFNTLALRAGMKPENILFLDDHEDYTQRASRLGFQAGTILTPTGHTARQLHDQPDLIDRLLEQGIIVMDRTVELRQLLTDYLQPSRA